MLHHVQNKWNSHWRWEHYDEWLFFSILKMKNFLCMGGLREKNGTFNAYFTCCKFTMWL